MRKLLLALLSVVAFGCGGDRYEIVTASYGGDWGGVVAYRLDKKTGEVLVIHRDTSRPVKIAGKR